MYIFNFLVSQQNTRTHAAESAFKVSPNRKISTLLRRWPIEPTYCELYLVSFGDCVKLCKLSLIQMLRKNVSFARVTSDGGRNADVVVAGYLTCPPRDASLLANLVMSVRSVTCHCHLSEWFRCAVSLSCLSVVKMREYVEDPCQ